MSSVFSRIIKGEIPSYRIAESESCYAFLDINPVAKGHTLVVPKIEVDYIFDLEDDLLASLFSFSKKTAQAIEKIVPCKRIGITVIGLEVPHAHIHLIPISDIGDMNFTQPKKSYSKEEFETLASQIQEAFASA